MLEQNKAHSVSQTIKDTLQNEYNAKKSKAIPVTGRGGLLSCEMVRWSCKMEAKYSSERPVDRRNNMFSVRQALNPSISFGLTLASKD
jgi:hypothetical protein